MISIITACDENNLIGYKNCIPWYIPEDLKLFKKRTLGNVIIMGKNTWQSLPKLFLDGRINIVISSNAKELFEETFLRI